MALSNACDMFIMLYTGLTLWFGINFVFVLYLMRCLFTWLALLFSRYFFWLCFNQISLVYFIVSVSIFHVKSYGRLFSRGTLNVL